MASLNKVQLIGRLGNDVDLRYTATGDAVANISVATSESWKDKSGQKQERTTWHNVTMFGKLAEIAGQYLAKGSQVYIEGKIVIEKYQDQQGNDKQAFKIHANSMQMLDSRQDGQAGQPAQNGQPKHQQAQQNRPPQSQQAAPNFDDFDDSIPF